MNRLASPYQKLIKYSAYLGPFVLLLVRLAWGYELMTTGWYHLHDIDTMVGRFTKWGVPMPHASVIISGTMEMVAGALWILGLGTRLISIPMVFNFCVAYATAHIDTVKSLFGSPAWEPTEFIDAAAFPFLVTSLLLVAFGPGLFSIDAIIKKLAFSKTASTSMA